MDLTAIAIEPNTRLRENIQPHEELAPECHLRLGSNCQMLPTLTGLVVRNDLKIQLYQGEGLAGIGSKIAPLMDGSRTVREICDFLCSDDRILAIQLMETLKHDGFAVICSEVPPNAPFLLSPCGRKQINFLAGLTDRPFEAFARFQNSRVLLVGSGRGLRKCVGSLVDSGLQHVTVLSLDEDEAILPQISGIAEVEKLGGSVNLVNIGSTRTSINLADFDLVSYFSSKVRLADLTYLNEVCAAESKTFFPGIVFGYHSVIGPIMQPREAGCWVCGLLRLSPEIVDDENGMMFLESQRSPDSGCVVPETMMADVAGTDMAFEIFKSLAGNFRPVLANAVLAQTMEEHGYISAETLPQSLCGCSRACEREIYSKQLALSPVMVEGRRS